MLRLSRAREPQPHDQLMFNDTVKAIVRKLPPQMGKVLYEVAFGPEETELPRERNTRWKDEVRMPQPGWAYVQVIAREVIKE